MFINNVKLTNVRNHTNSFYELDSEVIFVGENGSGKTTVLESLYYLFAIRGFKKQPLSSIVSFGQEFLRIQSNINIENLEYDVVLKYDGKRHIYSDDVLIDSIYDYMYKNPIAVYSTDFLGVLSTSHTDRRSFIDRYIYYTDKPYADLLRKYNHYISQKNAEFDKENYDKTYIELLNQELVTLSNTISVKRNEIIASINNSLNEIYKDTPFNMEVLLSYKTNIRDTALFEKEFVSRRTLYGIHRDKIEMVLGNKAIEKFSSFGQKKTFALFCLLSILKHVEQFRKSAIITLLDDFEAGLDNKRAGTIKELYSHGRQVIYTSVDASKLDYKKIIQL